MAYRIVYGLERKPSNSSRRRGVLIGAALALVLLGRHLGWGEYLIPGDTEVTTAAVEEMVSEITSGASVKEAFTEFCREIIDHGQLY